MGASASQVQQLLDAVGDGNLRKVENLLDQLSVNGEQRSQAVNYRAKDGRTPLIIAANKNEKAVAKLLLDNGADVHYVNGNLGAAGSALHEAVRKGHKEMSDLLLRYGANPFVCNDVHCTALDIAVKEGHTVMQRRFIEQAFFSGYVGIKWTKLLSKPFKKRYMVILPNIPFPGSAAQPAPPRRQLWIFKDSQAPKPLVRLWLDGSSAYRLGSSTMDGILRLHTSHPQPKGNVYSRYDRGYCMHVRPAVASSSGLSSSSPAPSPAAIETYERLLACCNFQGHIQVQQTGGTGREAVMSSPSLSAVNLPAPPHMAQVPVAGAPGLAPTFSMNSIGSGTAASVASSRDSLGPGSQGGVPPGLGPGSFGRTMSDQQHSNQNNRNASRAAAIGTQSSRGGSGPQPWLDSLQARPDESDDEFAARLAASMASGGRPRGPGAPPRPQPPSTARQVEESEETFALRMATAAAASGKKVDAIDAAPSAPPLPAAASQARTVNQEENLCIICLSAPPKAGFLHGSSVHRCVCTACSGHVPIGTPCPLCREPVERIIGVY